MARAQRPSRSDVARAAREARLLARPGPPRAQVPGAGRLQGGPLILVERGRLLRERMRQSLVDERDILFSARKEHGLDRLDQIKYAILETTGYISIIPAT